MRSGQTYAAFEQGFAGTRDLWVEDLEVTNEDGASATVRVRFSSVGQDGTVSRYEGAWVAGRAAGEWRLSGAYVTPL
jgi:hypothetical protein